MTLNLLFKKRLKFIYTVVALLSAVTAQGQVDYKDLDSSFLTTINSKYCCSDCDTPAKGNKLFKSKRKGITAVSEGTIRSVLKTQFSYLTLGRQQGAGIGNSAKVDIASDKTALTINLSLLNAFKGYKDRYAKAHDIVSLTINAGYKDDVGTLFSNATANGSAGATLKMSFVSRGSIGYRDGDCKRLVPAGKAITEYLEYMRIKKERVLKESIKEAKDNYTKVKKLVLDKRQEIDTLTKKRYTPAQVQKATEELDSLLVQQVAAASLLARTEEPTSNSADNIQYQSLLANPRTSIKVSKNSKSYEEQQRQILYRSLYDSLISFETSTINFPSVGLHWLDVFVSAQADGYNIFDDRAPEGDGLTTRTEGVYTFGGRYNYAILRRKSFLSFNGGAKLLLGNNLANAKTHTMEQYTLYQNGLVTNKIGETKSVYKVSETKAFEYVTTSLIDAQLMALFFNNTVGIDAFADLAFNHNGEAVTHTGIFGAGLGLVFAFHKQDEPKSRLNVELFGRLNDINDQDARSEKYTTWQRHTIGLKVSLPFEKLLLGK